MASTTPNRHYPFPQDPDAINVAGDLEALARAVDGDMGTILASGAGTAGSISALNAAIAAEATARANRDNELINDYIYRDSVLFNDYTARDTNVVNGVKVNAWIGAGDGSQQDNRNDKISIQAAYQIVALDGYAHAEVAYPIAFRFAPIVLCNTANSGMWQIATLGPPSSETPGTTAGSFHFTCRNSDGSTMSGGIVAFNFLAVGFLP